MIFQPPSYSIDSFNKIFQRSYSRPGKISAVQTSRNIILRSLDMQIYTHRQKNQAPKPLFERQSKSLIKKRYCPVSSCSQKIKNQQKIQSKSQISMPLQKVNQKKVSQKQKFAEKLIKLLSIEIKSKSIHNIKSGKQPSRYNIHNSSRGYFKSNKKQVAHLTIGQIGNEKYREGLTSTNTSCMPLQTMRKMHIQSDLIVSKRSKSLAPNESLKVTRIDKKKLDSYGQLSSNQNFNHPSMTIKSLRQDFILQ